MADALRYLANTAEATTYQPEPLSAVTSAKLTQACDMAEDAVDKYLALKGIDSPLTLNDLADTQQDLLKRAVSMMVAAMLFEQHINTAMQGDRWHKRAEEKLDEFIGQANLGQTTAQTRLGIANYQEEYVDNWDDPNETLKNMDE